MVLCLLCRAASFLTLNITDDKGVTRSMFRSLAGTSIPFPQGNVYIGEIDILLKIQLYLHQI